MKYMDSNNILVIAKGHILFGGNPLKKMSISEKIPLMMTCHPMAMYFSSELFNRKFHTACIDAERNKRIRAVMGMETFV